MNTTLYYYWNNNWNNNTKMELYYYIYLIEIGAKAFWALNDTNNFNKLFETNYQFSNKLYEWTGRNFLILFLKYLHYNLNSQKKSIYLNQEIIKLISNIRNYRS